MTFRNLLILIAGLMAILVLTLLAFRLPVADSLGLLAEGAFGDKFGMHRTIVKATPLLLVALGLILSWRAGMFNVGGDGQLLCGAMASASAYAIFHDLSPPLLQALILVSGILGGAAFALIPAALYARRGVNVVISTILLNFVAIALMRWAVRGPLQEPSGAIPQSEPLAKAVLFTRLDPQSDLHVGVILPFMFALALYVWLSFTVSGFRLRLVGSNPNAARVARIDVSRTQALSLVFSGAFCGLAGAVEYLGVSGYLFDGFSPNFGFLAIPVALLGGLHPIGVLASGVYFGALMAGSKRLEALGAAPSALVFVMQGVGVLGYVALQRVTRPRTREADTA